MAAMGGRSGHLEADHEVDDGGEDDGGDDADGDHVAQQLRREVGRRVVVACGPVRYQLCDVWQWPAEVQHMLRELFAHRASRPPPIHTRLPSLHASYTRLTATLVFLPPLLPSCPPLLPLALPMRVRCAHKRAGADRREAAGGRRTGGLLVDEDDALLEEDLDGRQVAARGQYQRVSRRSCEAIDSSHASARFLGHLHRRQAGGGAEGRRFAHADLNWRLTQMKNMHPV